VSKAYGPIVDKILFREYEILLLLSRGSTVPQIAGNIRYPIPKVHICLRSIRKKLRVSDNAAAIQVATQKGWV